MDGIGRERKEWGSRRNVVSLHVLKGHWPANATGFWFSSPQVLGPPTTVPYLHKGKLRQRCLWNLPRITWVVMDEVGIHSHWNHWVSGSSLNSQGWWGRTRMENVEGWGKPMCIHISTPEDDPAHVEVTPYWTRGMFYRSNNDFNVQDVDSLDVLNNTSSCVTFPQEKRTKVYLLQTGHRQQTIPS